MIRRRVAVILAVFVVLLAGLAVFQSHKIYINFQQNLPKFGIANKKIQTWMTVREIADKHNISEKEIFNELDIEPEPGDESLSLRALKKKYRKDKDEMQENTNRLLEKINRLKKAAP